MRFARRVATGEGVSTGRPIPRSVALAVELTRAGGRLVVVGGTARALRGSGTRARDLDVRVADDDVPPLVHALDALGVEVGERQLRRGRTVSLDTAWGPLDIFVGPGNGRESSVEVAGTELMVSR